MSEGMGAASSFDTLISGLIGLVTSRHEHAHLGGVGWQVRAGWPSYLEVPVYCRADHGAEGVDSDSIIMVRVARKPTLKEDVV
jgi:hypothetical protein